MVKLPRDNSYDEKEAYFTEIHRALQRFPQSPLIRLIPADATVEMTSPRNCSTCAVDSSDSLSDFTAWKAVILINLSYLRTDIFTA